MQIQVLGLSQCLAALRRADRKVRGPILRKAVTKAVQIVPKAAKPLTPVRPVPSTPFISGLLKKSQGWRVKSYRGRTVVGIAGPRKNFRRLVGVSGMGLAIYQDPAKYGHLVESGTAPHGYKTAYGTHPGARPKPFLKPAGMGARGQIETTMRGVMSAGINAMNTGP